MLRVFTDGIFFETLYYWCFPRNGGYYQAEDIYTNRLRKIKAYAAGDGFYACTALDVWLPEITINSVPCSPQRPRRVFRCAAITTKIQGRL